MYQDLPTPKFRIGEVVFEGTTFHTSEQLPCPDCAGSRKWLVKLPTGTEHEVPCQRCTDRYSMQELPGLVVNTYKPSVNQLTIASIRIDTFSDSQIQYMCHETGVGSGRLYHEEDLRNTESEAREIAELRANRLNAAEDAKREQQKKRGFSVYALPIAVVLQHQQSMRETYWKYRHLREYLEELVDDDSITDIDDLIQKIKYELDYEVQYRPAKAMTDFVEAVKRIIDFPSAENASALKIAAQEAGFYSETPAP